MKRTASQVKRRSDGIATQRKRFRLPRQLAAYSIAACAGVMAAEESSAEVIPIQLPGGAPIVVSEGPTGIDPFDLDIDGDGNFDFAISFYLGALVFESVSSPRNLNGIASDRFGLVEALLLSPGELIDGDLPGEAFYYPVSDLDHFRGTRGFAGVVFDIPGGSPHYAYLDIAVNADADELTLYGGAYESVANVGITTVPEPSCLYLFAMGAAGVAIWRRRREKTGS